DQRAENYLLNRHAIRHVAVNRAQRRRLSLRIVHCTPPNCAKRCCCARKDSKMVGSFFTGCWACFASCSSASVFADCQRSKRESISQSVTPFERYQFGSLVNTQPFCSLSR